MPRIDSLVDAAASSELMSLLDCYSGYHQIWMKKEDEPKTSFITPSGTYCYLRMPEGLKNAGGSFSRMTAKVLHSQIGRNVLTYVDDIIVKSTKQDNHIADLQETFANFRQVGLKLNPEKCVPLPRIDSLVDAAASSELMSLLDCYSGYHQIWMKKEDEPKTSFITPSGTYCYLRMPEGLKNAGGSFSRMTAKVLHSQIGRNVLTYVDDIIVKSTKQDNHIADLQETFANFRQVGLKLNPEKCVFGVKKRKFLGCLVSTKGIEANSSKIEAILRMEPPKSRKGAQRLAGSLP